MIIIRHNLTMSPSTPRDTFAHGHHLSSHSRPRLLTNDMAYPSLALVSTFAMPYPPTPHFRFPAYFMSSLSRVSIIEHYQ